METLYLWMKPRHQPRDTIGMHGIITEVSPLGSHCGRKVIDLPVLVVVVLPSVVSGGTEVVVSGITEMMIQTTLIR